MTDEAKKARREYDRKYYQQNKKRIAERQAAYWERKAKSESQLQGKGGKLNGK